MTAATYRRLWCDGPGSGSMCGANIGNDMPGETATELRRRARNEGWQRKDGRDLCPDCAPTPEVAK